MTSGCEVSVNAGDIGGKGTSALSPAPTEQPEERRAAIGTGAHEIGVARTDYDGVEGTAPTDHSGHVGNAVASKDEPAHPKEYDEYVPTHEELDRCKIPLLTDEEQLGYCASDILKMLADHVPNCQTSLRTKLCALLRPYMATREPVDCRKAFERDAGDTCFDRDADGKYEVTALEKRWGVWQRAWNARPMRDSNNG